MAVVAPETFGVETEGAGGNGAPGDEVAAEVASYGGAAGAGDGAGGGVGGGGGMGGGEGSAAGGWDVEGWD